jgi:hypothetical protein
MKPLQHATYRANREQQLAGNFLGGELKVSGQQQLTFQLRKRSKADPHKSAQFSVSHPTAAFCQVS